MERFGKVNVRLKGLLEQSGLSKNKFGQRAEMQRTQLNRYYNNTVTRLDTDVLARICTVLHCDIGELLEFVPPDGAEQEKE